ncbi:MAG: crotonase/enoyl-CoA hydratase family protein [Gammaproteobacteria bacterium]|jgi:enoyl-CoA hydratase|nr:crotonase/enoyl-CoA hydratase family protein [Gammaproteobacteria bacterium]
MDFSIDGGIGVFQIDDGKANAVSHSLIDFMMNGLDQAEANAAAVVLLGRPGVFSAGFDLKEIAKGPEEGARLVNRGARLLHRLFGFPMPVVAGCTGHAIAAGGFLLLASDTRIGTQGDFRLGLNETAIGMVLPVFGFELAANRIPAAFQTAAVVQAKLFTPQDAVHAGFLDQAVEPEMLQKTCLEHAAALCEMPTEVYGRQKREMRKGALARIHASLE